MNALKIIMPLHNAVFPFPKGWIDAQGQTASNLIRDRLLSGEPCLIGRFGSIELETMMAYLFKNKRMGLWERFYRFASWDVRYRGWKPALVQKLCNNAGFFPPEEPLMDQFAQLYIELAHEIDILGSWVHAEILLRNKMPSTQLIPLRDLEPYSVNAPWSKALAGKRVLVVHPFTQSITSQYKKRTLLFKNPDILPEFDLLTLRAVQSSGGATVPFATWFEALESMKNQVNQMHFDIALIGAGAYGLPLAAHIKSTRKKAVHLGGATQLLFGIYGQRWIDDPFIKPLINDYWIRPLPSEKTPDAHTIENGCYW